MNVAVLGSGSRGNAFALRERGSTLLIDAGFGPRSLAKRATRAGMSLDQVAAVVLTHEHGDHARGAAAVAEHHGCPVLASAGTLRGLTLDGLEGLALVPGTPHAIGPFVVAAARTSHDASEPLALAVTGRSGARVGVAYDLGRPTAAVRFLLRACTALILEANHDDVLLRTGPYPPAVRRRIAGSGGHLSNRAAAELAADAWGPDLRTVVLVHVSERCNRADLARETVRKALRRRGFTGDLLVAEQDEPLPAFSTTGPDQLSLSFQESLPPRSVEPREAPTPASSE